MRRTASAAVIAAAWPLAATADPLCCKLFEFDASAMLGQDAVACGSIVTADTPNEARDEASAARQRAARCALEAQSQRRAFVYTYRVLASPDIDMVTQAVFGAHGERMLLRMGLDAGQNIRRVERCASLTVLESGLVKAEGCQAMDPR